MLSCKSRGPCLNVNELMIFRTKDEGGGAVDGRAEGRLRLMTPRSSSYILNVGFPGGSVGKETACNAGDLGLIPVSGRSLGKRIGNPLQCSSGKSHGQKSLESYRPWGHK